jgi:pimeloyl-ACP methyl ester carboxylesterase
MIGSSPSPSSRCIGVRCKQLIQDVRESERIVEEGRLPSMMIGISDRRQLYVEVSESSTKSGRAEAPTIVLLHGGPGGDHTRFKTDMPGLPEIGRIIYFDQCGSGLSSRGRKADWNLNVWADDLVRLCASLKISRPIILGLSFGGFVAQRYLSNFPHHPAAVILLATGPRFDSNLTVSRFSQIGGSHTANSAQLFWNAGTNSPEKYADIHDQYRRDCFPYYRNLTPNVSHPDRADLALPVLQHFNAGELSSMDLAQGTNSSRCPILVVSGESDPVCPPELWGGSWHPNVRIENLRDASHLDIPSLATGMVADFVSTIDC